MEKTEFSPKRRIPCETHGMDPQTEGKPVAVLETNFAYRPNIADGNTKIYEGPSSKSTVESLPKAHEGLMKPSEGFNVGPKFPPPLSSRCFLEAISRKAKPFFLRQMILTAVINSIQVKVIDRSQEVIHCLIIRHRFSPIKKRAFADSD